LLRDGFLGPGIGTTQRPKALDWWLSQRTRSVWRCALRRSQFDDGGDKGAVGRMVLMAEA